MGYTDTTFRTYGKSKYEKTDKGWAKQVEEKQQTVQSGQKEYTDEELAGFARKASDASLKKAGAGANERMRIAAKKELLRRQREGASEPEPSENPFDDGMKKGLFDEFPTRMFGDTEYINKGEGWEVLEKGRKASIGEIRDWKGGKYQKTATGWVPYTQGQGGPAKKDGEGVSKDVVEKISSMSDSELAEFKEGCAEIVDANKSYIEFRKKTKWSGGLEDSEKVVAKYESYIKAIEQEEVKRKSKADSTSKDGGASDLVTDSIKRVAEANRKRVLNTPAWRVRDNESRKILEEARSNEVGYVVKDNMVWVYNAGIPNKNGKVKISLAPYTSISND